MRNCYALDNAMNYLIISPSNVHNTGDIVWKYLLIFLKVSSRRLIAGYETCGR